MSRAGSITRDASGRWQFVVDLTPPGATKRKQVRRRGFPTKKAAQAELDELKGTIRAGSFVAPTRMTLGEYLAAWLDGLPASGRRATTIRGYRWRLGRVIAHAVGETRLQDVAAVDLDRLYSDLLTGGGTSGGALSAGTVRLIAVSLSAAFSDAVRTDILPRNPASKARPPSASSAQRHALTVWTPDELKAFLAATCDHTHAVLWRTLAMTGLRRGEGIGLRWSDLDLEHAALSVAQAVTVAGGAPTIGPPKTSRSRRRVDLDPLTVAALRAHRKAQAAQRLLIGAGWKNLDLVFPKVDGAAQHPDGLTHAFKRQVANAGVPRIRLHDLRHTHAVHLLAAGANPRMVSERLGHTSVAFTLDRYGHVLKGQQSSAAAAVAALVDGTP
jgi:integrase